MSRSEVRKRRMVTAERRLAEHTTGGGKSAFRMPAGVNMFNPKKTGEYRLRVVPFTVGKGNPYADPGDYYYERTYKVHNYVGAAKEAFICAADCDKVPCAVCDYRNKLSGENPEPGKAMEELLKSFYPKERQLWNVYDLNDTARGVQIWDISFHNFGTFLDAKIERAKGDPVRYKRLKAFADPEKGFELVIGASEKTMGGKGSKPFLIFSDIEFHKPEEPLPDEILDAATCLDDLIISPEYKKTKAYILQSTAKDESEDEESEESEDDGSKAFIEGDEVSFKYKGKDRTGTITEVDEENELYHVQCEDRDKPYNVSFDDDSLTAVEAAEEEDEEEEEEAPAPKKKPAKKPAGKKKFDDDDAEEEEEESEEEDEEEEEEAEPAPKKKPVKKPVPKKKPAKNDDEEADDVWGDDDEEAASESEEEEEEETEEEEEEPAPKKKPVKKPAKKPAGKKKPAVEEEEEEEEAGDDDGWGDDD